MKKILISLIFIPSMFSAKEITFDEKFSFTMNSSGVWFAQIGLLERYNLQGVDVKKSIPMKLDFSKFGSVQVDNLSCKWVVKNFEDSFMEDGLRFGGFVKCKNKRGFSFIAWNDEVAEAHYPTKSGLFKISYKRQPYKKKNDGGGELW
ncbi:hypothetical protein [Endozoicomonas sp. ALC066]|uniref:hypothetical protein n=1 Tax=Endozoicomonas sp. ALC066 TaxID=3403078 RepID=UPI003BB70F1B